MLPALYKMLGLGEAPLTTTPRPLAEDLPANGPRAHYMRAITSERGVIPMHSQDSALLRIMSDSDALIVRAPFAPAMNAGDLVDIILL
jgi:molybdopterin molybdotransferase